MKTVENQRIESLAQELYQADVNCSPVEALTERYAEITNEEAYKVQLAGMALRLQAGHILVGKKIGLTSKAMQNALGVFEPDYGYITDRMVAMEGEPLSMAQFISPKVEAEIAFILKADLPGPGITVSQVLQATAGIMPALEIIDTRIKNWKIKIQDTIADGASIGRIVLGGRMTPVDAYNLKTLGLVLEKNGEVVATAAGAAVLGHPANAVVWLGNKLATYGMMLKAGDIVMSGSLTAACPMAEGDYIQANFADIGSVSVKFVK